MTAVKLKASGYTWRCPECQVENYTGAAPATVRCSKCHGAFGVGSLVHRRGKARDHATPMGANSGGEQRSLFDATPTDSDDGEIPF